MRYEIFGRPGFGRDPNPVLLLDYELILRENTIIIFVKLLVLLLLVIKKCNNGFSKYYPDLSDSFPLSWSLSELRVSLTFVVYRVFKLNCHYSQKIRNSSITWVIKNNSVFSFMPFFIYCRFREMKIRMKGHRRLWTTSMLGTQLSCCFLLRTLTDTIKPRT